VANLCISEIANVWQINVYPQTPLIHPVFAHELSQAGDQPQNDERESNNGLDAGTSWAHLAKSNDNAVNPELVAYVDGGCLGNPGPSGIGVIINGCASGPVHITKWIGHQDNNVAEYAALMEALQYAVSKKACKLHVFSDSQVVVRQMTGEYICRSPRLYSLHWTCRKLARSLKFSISHVRREENAEANRLAQSALKRRRR
jgi:ribonuclease HI